MKLIKIEKVKSGGEYRYYRCNCGRVFIASFGFYGTKSGRGNCKCGAELIIN